MSDIGRKSSAKDHLALRIVAIVQGLPRSARSTAWARIGVPAMPPLVALVLSVPLGLPATWAAARWVRGLIDEAGRRPGDRGASRH